MKNLFGTKKAEAEKQVGIDLTGFPKHVEIPENVAEEANMDDVKQASAGKIEGQSEPQWKSFNGNSCGEVIDFLNVNKVDPLFMLPGANGQIRVFYKA